MKLQIEMQMKARIEMQIRLERKGAKILQKETEKLRKEMAN